MARTYDIAELSAMLAAKAISICEWLLPNGKQNGSEWLAGNVYGDAGDSLRVSVSGSKAGVWTDFASDEKGGDLIDLIRAVRGCSLRDAVKEAKEFLGVSDHEPKFVPERKAYKPANRPNGLTKPKSPMLEWFAKRGISEATVKAYRVGEIERNGKPVAVFPYMHGSEIAFIKYRPLADKKGMWTSKDSAPALFGWQVIPDEAREIIICEGELDAMAFYEAGYPAVSVPRGGGDGEKQDGWIAVEWERLQLFDTIVLALDKDDQGQSACNHISRRLGQHRCVYPDFAGSKDANDFLLAGGDFNAMMQNLQSKDPDELRSAAEYIDEIYDFFQYPERTKGDPLPWEKLSDRVGLREGETTIWAGINGHGKSQIIGHIAVDSMARGNRWCVASMEFRPHKWLSRMVRQMIASNQPSPEDRQAICDFWNDRLWVFDVQGTAKADRILEVFEYAYRRYGVKHFLIDSLAKCGFGEDAYNEQKAFVDKLSDFARDNELQVHLVCHSRKKEDEGKVPDKFDIKGTGAIVDMVDNAFVIWRNKPKEEETHKGGQSRAHEGDAVLYCCKQRNGEWEGKFQLWFDKRSLQYMDASNGKPLKYIKYQGENAKLLEVDTVPF